MTGLGALAAGALAVAFVLVPIMAAGLALIAFGWLLKTLNSVLSPVVTQCSLPLLHIASALPFTVPAWGVVSLVMALTGRGFGWTESAFLCLFATFIGIMAVATQRRAKGRKVFPTFPQPISRAPRPF